MVRKKVILTGFLPFGDYGYNPTEECARYYNHRNVYPDIEIIGVILPCTYLGAFEILSEIIDKEKPDAIISMGLSSCSKGIRIEVIFRNLMNGKYPDNDGYEPKCLPIDKNSRWEFISPQSNGIFFANVLHSEKIPVEISSDADTFIGNALGYLTTKKILDNNLNIRNMFIHIPWTDNYKGVIYLGSNKIFIKKRDYYDAIELLIKSI